MFVTCYCQLDHHLQDTDISNDLSCPCSDSVQHRLLQLNAGHNTTHITCLWEHLLLVILVQTVWYCASVNHTDISDKHCKFLCYQIFQGSLTFQFSGKHLCSLCNRHTRNFSLDKVMQTNKASTDVSTTIAHTHVHTRDCCYESYDIRPKEVEMLC